MNQLSWLIYWADVLPSMAELLLVLSAFGFSLSGFGTLLYVTAGFGGWNNEYDKEYLARFRFFPYFLGLFALFVVATQFVPSKGAFYMIAASQAGEQALQTAEMVKLRAVLNKWMDDQIKPVEEGETPSK